MTFVLFIQLINGLNYPLLTVAGVAYADEHAPEGFRATAQGLFYVAYAGIGSAIGGFAGGLFFENMGAKGMYKAYPGCNNFGQPDTSYHFNGSGNRIDEFFIRVYNLD